MKLHNTVALLMLGIAAPAQSQQAPEPAFRTVQGAFFAVSVADLDASIAWYRDKLGLREASRFRFEKITGALLTSPGLEVEIMSHAEATTPGNAMDANAKVLTRGITKVGVRVDNLDAAVRTLRQRGVAIVLGPFPARRDQRANVVIRDNAGNLIQLFGDFAP
jgi:catechol 2,3-dioxygenase-like lactoylglutathione lyase family enzyme